MDTSPAMTARADGQGEGNFLANTRAHVRPGNCLCHKDGT